MDKITNERVLGINRETIHNFWRIWRIEGHREGQNNGDILKLEGVRKKGGKA